MRSERFESVTNTERHPAAGTAARRAALVGLALVVAAGCASPKLAPPPKARAVDTYRVGAPDVLAVTILPDPRIEKEVVVRPDGMISIDLVGDVPAAGRTTEQIAQDVQKRIARYKRGASVTVAVSRASSTSVTLLGEMNANRAFPLFKETRVAEAIALTGGLNSFANRDNLRVIRNMGGETVMFTVDMDAIQSGDLRTNIVLADGDIVYAPPTVWAKVGHAINALLYPLQPFLQTGMRLGANALSSTIGF